MEEAGLRAHTLFCALCGQEYQVSYRPSASEGLCSACFQKDRMRELDRVLSARHLALKEGLRADLRLDQWLAIIVNFGGRCAFCQRVPYSAIDLFIPDEGLTASNVAPICAACAVHKAIGFEVALERVASQLTCDYTRLNEAQAGASQ